ncbi:hypothetical protein BZZ01_04895 [Nostocales cyanobacterium HT-58-2]|nr:hypothetical protein BZZ01_04895 [Nostocales cyanobacterium HT-58-2]
MAILFTMADVARNWVNFGYPCGNTFIPNRSKCWTDPKTGARLKIPITYQIWQRIQGSKGKAAQSLYRDREQRIREQRRAAVPGWRKQQPAPPKPEIDTSKPMGLEEFRDFNSRLLQGQITAEEVKATWERIKKSEPQLREELQKLKKDQLTRLNTGYVWSNAKKEDLVRGALAGIQERFAPVGYSYTIGNPNSRIQAIDKAVNEWTDELIQEKANAYKQRTGERQEKILAIKKAIENPETLEDFKTRESYTKNPLTPEQRRRYDELLAESNLQQRQAEIEKRGKVSAVEKEGIKLSIQQTKHTKHGHDLHVVSLDERVDRDTYNKLNERAKKLGGYYSSYAKDGAIPGFQFKDKKSAEEFLGLEEVNKAGDRIAQKQEKATESLTAKAEALKEDAEGRLSQDRLTNTARRVRMAESAESRASGDIFMANTMANIANAISEGRAKYLTGINSKAQVEQLESLLKRAHGDRARDESKDLGYSQYRNIWEAEPDEKSIEYTEYPYPNIHKSVLKDLIEATKDKPGLKALAAKMRKRYNEVHSNENMHRVKFQDPQSIQDFRDFINRAEKAFGSEKSTPEGRSYSSSFLRWNAKEGKEALQEYDRLQRAGITSAPELRVALREYLNYRGKGKDIDPIKRLERDLVGTKIAGYFPTPDRLADHVIETADIKPGMKVLEPSAGKGSLVDAVKRKHGEDVDVTAVEVNSKLADILKAKGYNPNQADFLDLKDGDFDRIIMNPPFENGQDVEHVRHAYDLLAPGGKVVAIMSEGSFFRSDRKSEEFRDWLSSRGKAEKLPEGSFKTSDNPTGVSTRLVVLEKPKRREYSISRQLTEFAQPLKRRLKRRANFSRQPIRDPKGGLTAAGRRHFRRKFGNNLKPGVKKPQHKMSLEDMRRKGSWATRFYGRSKLPPLKDKKGRPTRFALTAAAWGEPVPRTVAQARAIATKGRRLLKRYHQKKNARN